MKIGARVQNSQGSNKADVSTNDVTKSVPIPAKESGLGSSVNGGELLCLALATCFCNDIYREAADRGIDVKGVEVNVEAEFGAPGEPARRITYSARVTSDATDDEINDLDRAH